MSQPVAVVSLRDVAGRLRDATVSALAMVGQARANVESAEDEDTAEILTRIEREMELIYADACRVWDVALVARSDAS